MTKGMYELKGHLCDKLEEMSQGGNISRSDLQDIHMLTDTIKNLCKIETLSEGASYGEWTADGSYGRGAYNRGASNYGDDYSSARGRHYVRGHYSYGDDMDRMRNGERY